MTIEFIDHALNVVLTGLFYGSETWIVSAFGLYVATHERPTPSYSQKKDTVSNRSVVQTKDNTSKTTKALPIGKPPTPILTYPTEPVQITCEPINWKKWKVSDLRKANLAKICGVRTRPIGSRRNLTKTDLIAQYEQQLKRFTKSPKTQEDGQRKKTIA